MKSARDMGSAGMKMKPFETSDSSLFASSTREELLVSQILLGLENLIPLPIFIWGFRKRRSCLDGVQLEEKEDIDEFRRPLVEADKEENTASSPSTPFSFSPSESDGKFNRSSENISEKKSRAELNDEIEESTKRGDLPREESETCQRKEEPEEDIGRFLNLATDFIQHDETIMLPHGQPLFADQTAHLRCGAIRTQVYPPNNGFEPVNRLGPSAIPDLNLTAEETFGVDPTRPLDVNQETADKRARFAETRRIRKGIMKTKSMRRASGIKIPRT